LIFSEQIFGKYSNIKFHEIPSSGRRTDAQMVRRKGYIATERQTDGNDGTYSPLFAVCKST